LKRNKTSTKEKINKKATIKTKISKFEKRNNNKDCGVFSEV
jgi:hypothetical protein